MRNCFVLSVLLALTVFFPAAGATQQADDIYMQVVGLIHMDSEISGGENSLDMLAAAAKNAGAEVAIVTDHDTQRVTYGIWPLRNIIKATHTRASVIQYGVRKYMSEVNRVNRQTPDFTFIPGIEAVPYYRWETSPATGKLVIKNLHRHMLVFGMDKPEQIEHLPSTEAGYPSVFTPFSLLQILWVIPLILAVLLFKMPGSHEYYETKFLLRLFYRPRNIMAILLGAISIIFLINGFPYSEQVVNQYNEDADALPYQLLIDYVNRQGGYTFWAHPEAKNYQSIITEKGSFITSLLVRSILKGGVDVETDPYFYLLNDTQDYTGFSIFFEGKYIIGKPEGLWDDILMQFVTGKRRKPVWAIAEIDMEEGTDPKTASESQTVFLVKEKTKDGYLEAIRTGKVYCYCDHFTKWLTIRDYSVIAGDTRAISGEILRYTDDARLIFDVEMRGMPRPLEAVIVKDGRIFARKEFNGSEHMVFPLPAPVENMGYVRIVVNFSGGIRVATNPIFLTKSGKL